MNLAPLHDAAVSDPPISRRVDLAVIIPTYNESGNIPELVARLEETLTGLTWEVVFVDDDSPDGTAELISAYSRRDYRIRLIHRIGRRGLSSACIEGILATTANYIAIMDADMQHDEAILPEMLATLRADSLDLVVGTRNAQGGSMGEFGSCRKLLSHVGQRVSHAVCRCQVSDPMSGFFIFTRSFFFEVVHRLHRGGFKILVDMLACAERPVRFAEVGYTFRSRKHGESKLDVNTAVEYLYLVIDRLADRVLPTRLAAFSVIGATGMLTQIIVLATLLFSFHLHFLAAQIAATYAVMTENFFLNHLIIWRDYSLRGRSLLTGLLSFCVACSFGAWANVVFGRELLHLGAHWYLAGLAGIIVSLVWNYAVASFFTWQTPHPSNDDALAFQAAYRADLSN